MLVPARNLLWIAGLLLIPLCGVAGFYESLKWPCVAFLAFLATALCVDAWHSVSRLTGSSVTAVLDGQTKWIEGREGEIAIQVRLRPGRYQLALQMPEAFEASESHVSFEIDAKSKTVNVKAKVETRGRYRIRRCFIRTVSPFGFWLWRVEYPIELEVRVYPDLHREPGAAVLFHRLRTGLRHQPPAGRGREFERLREYATGDSFDEIAWKATARRGRPVVRVFQVERTQDVYAIVDGSRLSAREGRLEQYIRAALLLALEAENEGDNFGLAVFNHQVIHFVRANRGANHFARCREALFDLEVSRKTPDFAELFTTLQMQIRRRALLLFLTSLEDAMLAENFVENARVLPRKHLAVVGYVQDEGTEPLFSRPAADSAAIRAQLAGHLQWASLRETTKSLERIGVSTCPLRKEMVAMDLISRYREIKRRQIL